MAEKAILVIDSDTETAQSIVLALESRDFLVFIASTGDFGITMAKRIRPVLIFVNPAISGASGLEICRTIHEMEVLRNVPIVAISPFEGEMDQRYRSEYGIVASLKKPFTPEELVAKTMDVLSAEPPAEGQAVEEETVERPVSEEEAAVQSTAPDKGTGKGDRVVVRLKEKKEGREQEGTVQTAQTQGEPAPESPEEPPRPDEMAIEEETDFPPRKMARPVRLAPVLIAAAIIFLGVAGVALFKTGLIPGTAPQKKVTARPSLPALPQVPVTPKAPEQAPLKEVQPPAGITPPAAVKHPPVQTAVKRPDAKALYSVQIGAFRDEKNAEALLKQFKEKGYDAFVQSIPGEREMLHRVLIGKFEDRKEAWRLASEIRSKENISTTVAGD